ncbi:hypothetical protein MIZ03_4112 [Rhodoferax lithotrophicus]|uniref:Uncharacterized protein n=1 Tax=Rhodoferax lithotrophicus TaxID=2798804 RepID=A0ABM7MS62_9BURK|nr:hypothetical protein MIZ03_4112 [Rhodoferax sp. MIZ03]
MDFKNDAQRIQGALSYRLNRSFDLKTLHQCEQVVSHNSGAG